MKKIIIAIFLLISTLSYGRLIFVAHPDSTYTGMNTASDSNDGSFLNPYATWQKAFEEANRGDTVYFRGGVYEPTATLTASVPNPYAGNVCYISPENGFGDTGTPDSLICFFNYPGERPILDCNKIVHPDPNPMGDGNMYECGIYLEDTHWLHFKGLTIRNLYQRDQYVRVRGIAGFPISNCTFENMEIYNISGEGMYIENIPLYQNLGYGWDGTGIISNDTIAWFDSDVYQCCDTLASNTGNEPGNMGDGFKIATSVGTVLLIKGCRVWHCSDDGMDLPGNGQKILIGNWSFNHNYPEYDFEGNGFKIGAMSDSITSLSTLGTIFSRNLSAFNYSGLFLLEYEGYFRQNAWVVNNTFYRDSIGLSMSTNIYYPTAYDNYFQNNVFYNMLKIYPAREMMTDFIGSEADGSWNINYSTIENSYQGSIYSWDYNSNYTVTDADFLEVNNVDVLTELTAPRKPGGALPHINFLNLAESSDLVDTGQNLSEPDSISSILAWTADKIGYSFMDSVAVAMDLGFAERGVVNECIRADHTVVDLFDDIPQRWIDSVKTKLVWVPGMSHGYSILRGAELLGLIDSRFPAKVWYHTDPPAPQSDSLRIGRPGFGGAEGWTTMNWINNYVNNVKGWTDAGNPVFAMWSAHSYEPYWSIAPGGVIDPVYQVHWAGDLGNGLRWGIDYEDEVLTGNSRCMETYVDAVDDYRFKFDSLGYDTYYFYSSLVCDDYYNSENGLQGYYKNQWLTEQVTNRAGFFLDYYDICVYNDAGEKGSGTWNGITYDWIHPDNLGDDIGIVVDPSPIETHIGDVGCVRMAKAYWWLLARAAGWDGYIETAPDEEAPTAPTNLIVTDSTYNSIDLSWTASTDNVGVYRYLIYRNSTKIDSTASTSFTDTGLNAETLYNYQVFARDAANNISTGSNIVYVTTESIPVSSDSIKVYTLQQLNDSLAFGNRLAGDIVYLAAEDFVGNVTMSCFGESGNLIYVKPALGYTPTITGNVIISGQYLSVDSIVLVGQTSITGSHNRLKYDALSNPNAKALYVYNCADAIIDSCLLASADTICHVVSVIQLQFTNNYISTSDALVLSFTTSESEARKRQWVINDNDYIGENLLFCNKPYGYYRSKYAKIPFDSRSTYIKSF